MLPHITPSHLITYFTHIYILSEVRFIIKPIIRNKILTKTEQKQRLIHAMIQDNQFRSFKNMKLISQKTVIHIDNSLQIFHYYTLYKSTNLKYT